MKKKLNLLWNLKFNFFSVAERPLTFFAYFLNAKKVGRRRLVIVPAKAGDFPLFPHAASVPAPALAPIRSHFACGETARPVVAPTGGNVLAPPFSLCSNVAPRSHPGPPRFQLGFCCAKTGGRVPPLSDGGALTKSENIILCASSCHPPRSPYPHCTLPHVRFSGIGQKKKPQRKTAAVVNTLYMSCKKTSVNPISFPVALCTKISPFKAIHLLSQCKTKIQFLWMRMRKRSAN